MGASRAVGVLSPGVLAAFGVDDIGRFAECAGANRVAELRKAAPPKCVAPGKRLPAPWMLQVLAEAHDAWRPWMPLPER
eukprot:3098619-Alexandrium_andersonii.AAC.1